MRIESAKKIAVYTESYLPAIGGLENNTALLCESLVNLGFRVSLLTPQKNAKDSKLYRVVESCSLKIYFKEFKQHDLLIVNGGVAFKAIMPALCAGIPYLIIYQMATLYRDIRDASLKTKSLNFLRKTLATYALKNVAVSLHSYEELTAAFGYKKSGLLINPADRIFIPSGDEQSKPHNPLRCMFAGRLIDGKGVGLLIEAVKKLNKDKVMVQLCFVGDGPERARVVDESVLSFIQYHPPVDKMGFKGLLAQTDLVVIPSTHHIEGSPLVMAEALVMGLPVLVSMQPAMATSIGYADLIFKSGNLEDLKNKLLALCNPVIYQRASVHCGSISKQYSYNSYISGLKTFVYV